MFIGEFCCMLAYKVYMARQACRGVRHVDLYMLAVAHALMFF